MPDAVLVEGVHVQPPEHDTLARLVPRYVPGTHNEHGPPSGPEYPG